MWVGWNAIRDNKQVTKQKIWYLQQINESPTSYSVVFKTMRRSSEIAKACNRDSIAVKIQNEEKPVFDQLFVHLGAFHIKMALLKAFRKVIEESGGPYFSNECDVLAKGSMSSVCKGKTNKRAKHMYQLLALVMQILHFESFLDKNKDSRDTLDTMIQQNEINTGKHDSISKEVLDLFENYQTYPAKTVNGNHGKTVEF